MPGRVRLVEQGELRGEVDLGVHCEPKPSASSVCHDARLADAAPNRRWTLFAVCVTTFMLLVDITIVNVALPSIQRRLGASLSGLEWVVDAYAITLAALILTAGALADRYGRRVLFGIGVGLFSAASFLCGVAWNIAALDAARALQGVGGAALFATALALIGAEYQGAERGRAIAVWGSTVGFAVAAGPLLGGLITDSLGWRWIFFVNVPVGAFALVVAMRNVRESRDPAASRTDVAGLVCLSASLFLIVFGLLRGNAAGWSSAQIVASLGAGLVLLAAFVVVEVRQERPMLDVSLFRQPAFLGVQLATFCLGAGMFALFPYLSIYLQDIDGNSPLGAGLRFLPITAFVFFVPLADAKSRRARPALAAALGEPRGRGARPAAAGAGRRPDRGGPCCCPASSSAASASGSPTRRSPAPRCAWSTRPAAAWHRASATRAGSADSRSAWRRSACCCSSASATV